MCVCRTAVVCACIMSSRTLARVAQTAETRVPHSQTSPVGSVVLFVFRREPGTVTGRFCKRSVPICSEGTFLSAKTIVRTSRQRDPPRVPRQNRISIKKNTTNRIRGIVHSTNGCTAPFTFGQLRTTASSVGVFVPISTIRKNISSKTQAHNNNNFSCILYR